MVKHLLIKKFRRKYVPSNKRDDLSRDPWYGIFLLMKTY